jgi:hypothetical protein
MTERKSIFKWQLFVGFLLVITGGLFLADQFLAYEIMGKFWPLLIVLLGIAFFIDMLTTGKRGVGLAIPGSVITVAGIILLIHNTFDLWITWTYAWGLLISAVGFGLLLMNTYLKRDGLRKAAGWVIAIGLILFVLFGILFEVIFDLADTDIESGVFFGSGLVLLGIFVVFSRVIFSRRSKKADVSKAPLEKPVVDAEEDQPAPAKKQETHILFEEQSEFTQLDFHGAGELYLEQGDICTLRIEGDQDLIGKVRTIVADEILAISISSDEVGFQKLKLIAEESRLKYYLTVKKLTGLNLSGFSSIHGSKLIGNTLSIVHSGEGTMILLGIQYQQLHVTLKGMGEINLNGEVQSQDVDFSGLGAYVAENLKTQQTNITVSGAGSAKVWAETELNATLTGAGSIQYKGHPMLEKSITGLGSIKPLENS